VYANTTTNPTEVAIMKLNIIILIIVFGLLTTIIPVSALNTGDVSGQVEFIIRTGGSVLDKTVYIKNVVDTNESYMGYPITVQPCGISLPEILIPGTFTATLYNGNGNHIEVQKFTILPGDNKRVVFIGQAATFQHIEYDFSKSVVTEPLDACAPDANFIGSVTSGDTPLTVTFTDTSTCSPTSWHWESYILVHDNDGSHKSELGTSSNPTYIRTFTVPGIYDVVLTAYNDEGFDSIANLHYIVVTSPTPPIDPECNHRPQLEWCQ
jgi:PKD repeat protein